MSPEGFKLRGSVVEAIVGICALLLLLAGCVAVLRPFLWAALWAAILCFSTWPIFRRLPAWIGARRSLAAAVMTVILAVVMAAPFAIVGWGLAGEAKDVASALKEAFAHGPPQLPDWIVNLPLVGSRMQEAMKQLADPVAREARERAILMAVREDVIYVGAAVAHGVVQICLSLLIGFFLYRDGESIGRSMGAIVTRLAGAYQGARMLEAAQNTVMGVVYGVLGTALMHGLVAAVGFYLAGVPGVLLLAFSTFVLSVLPFGPGMIWVPAALWLLHQGARGDALFLVIWGIVGNGAVDSFVRPYLISRGGGVPLILVILGVFGGAAAFGFIGVFLGPTLLAIGYGLFEDWSEGIGPAGGETAVAPPQRTTGAALPEPNLPSMQRPGSRRSSGSAK